MMNPRSTHHHSADLIRSMGYTFVEVISVVGVLAVMSSVAFVVGSKVLESSKATKLDSDVATLNSAVKIYLGSGGKLGHVTKPEDVLDALKTTRTAAEQKRFAGAPASSMVDRRITAVMQSAEEAASDEPRALWLGSENRFKVARSGGGGVKEFAINEAWSERAIATEMRDGSAMAFASGKEKTWIWDAGNWKVKRGNIGATWAATNPEATPETVSVEPEPAPLDGGEEEETVEEGGSGVRVKEVPIPQLSRVYFDPAPGAYPISQFPMKVTIRGLPDPASGEVVYKIGNAASWTAYSGVPILLASGDTLYAMAISLDTKKYLDSRTTSGKYVGLVESFTGSSGGLWTSPVGGVNLVTEINNGSEMAEFSHGDTKIDLGGEILDAGVQNRINYEPKQIAGVAPNQKFEIGTLVMHNGTTFNDSEAEKVTLRLSLDLGELGGSHEFDLPFAMENTENSDDREASADVVELVSTRTPVRPTIGGVRYDLILTIGIADNNGFTQGTKFLIYEGATAKGKIYGTFVPRY